MGAFGTAFTLATNIDVLPMLIYTEFTLAANFSISAALSVGLGIITWLILRLPARSAEAPLRRPDETMRDRLIFTGQFIFTLLGGRIPRWCRRSCRSPPASR